MNAQALSPAAPRRQNGGRRFFCPILCNLRAVLDKCCNTKVVLSREKGQVCGSCLIITEWLQIRCIDLP